MKDIGQAKLAGVWFEDFSRDSNLDELVLDVSNLERIKRDVSFAVKREREMQRQSMGERKRERERERKRERAPDN